MRFQLWEEGQQQQQEQQEGSMSHMFHCTTSGIKTGRKLLFFKGFRRDVRDFLGSDLERAFYNLVMVLYINSNKG